MEICAALYGCNNLHFLADEVTDSDVEGFLKTLQEAGIEYRKSSGRHEEYNFIREGVYAGNFVRSPQRGDRGIDYRIKIAMLPYADLLIKPDFVSAHVSGQEAIEKILASYTFHEIITSTPKDVETFRQAFPNASKIPIRPQSEQEIGRSMGFLYEWLI